jgi:DNA-binding XRE family transcriptional regulator
VLITEANVLTTEASVMASSASMLTTGTTQPRIQANLLTPFLVSVSRSAHLLPLQAVLPLDSANPLSCLASMLRSIQIQASFLAMLLIFSRFTYHSAMRMREFGVRLTRFRERAKLSITQLARYAGVDYMQISRYEKGATVPSLDTAVKIAQTLPRSPGSSVGRAED